MRLRCTVNGRTTECSTHPMRRLLDILREDLGLTGTKEGCGEGECGACTVLLDGAPVTSCMVPAIQLEGRDIRTIEGIGSPKAPHPLQRLFVEEGAVQCGFCTPGMILAALALLQDNPTPDRAAIRFALSGNLCRCTGYEAIFRAVERAAAEDVPTFPPREGMQNDTPQSPRFDPGEEGRFTVPRTLDEALEHLAEHPGARAVLAGGTDVMPDMRKRGTLPESAVDISRLPELHRIRVQRDRLHIGAGATNAELQRNPNVQAHFPCLVEAARRSGAPTIQHRATIGGNLMTASPAADLPPLLMALDASVTLACSGGTRTIPVAEHITGYRETACHGQELLTEISIPLPGRGRVQRFSKRATRQGLSLARVALGCSAGLFEGRLGDVRIACGSMTPVPMMLEEVMAFLEGKHPDSETIRRAGELAAAAVEPRKTPHFRKHATRGLVEQFLREFQP